MIKFNLIAGHIKIIKYSQGFHQFFQIMNAEHCWKVRKQKEAAYIIFVNKCISSASMDFSNYQRTDESASLCINILNGLYYIED